jgi:hypothetical protein
MPRDPDQRLALFTRVEEETTSRRMVRVHRLLQDLVCDELTPSELTARQQAVENLVRERTTALEQTTRWESGRWEIEPLDALANLWADSAHAQASWLSQAAYRWHHLAEWARAEPLMRRAVEIFRTSLGEEHPNTVAARENYRLLREAMRADS